MIHIISKQAIETLKNNNIESAEDIEESIIILSQSIDNTVAETSARITSLMGDGKYKEAKDLIDLIQEINRMKDSFINEKIEKQIQNHSKKELIEVDSLKGDFVYTKPVSFTFGQYKADTSSWSELVKELMTHLDQKYDKELRAAAELRTINKLSVSSYGFVRPCYLPNSATYIEMNRKANVLAFFLKEVLNNLNLNEKDLKILLRKTKD